MNHRKLCFVTGTRAEFGLLYELIKKVDDDPDVILQLVATGMHLSPEFGLTYREILDAGFYINKKVEIILSADTPTAIGKSTGLGLIGLVDALAELKPDVMVILGDRFEMLAASIAAMFLKIPIAHISGGETTIGAFDEAIRHSITKMSWWHFVAAEQYKNRVIQLGEDPKRIFLVGDPGVERINRTKLLTQRELEEALSFKFGEKNLMVTFHPVTLEHETSLEQFAALLGVLDELDDTNFIFTGPNADTDGRVILDMIKDYVNRHSARSILVTSMGQTKYLSTLSFVDGVIGNSSSGLVEAPTFKIGTINIGDRQGGRLRASSIIDCDPNKGSIKAAIGKLYSCEFQELLRNVVNPYGEGRQVSDSILDVIKGEPLPRELKKTFFDL